MATTTSEPNVFLDGRKRSSRTWTERDARSAPVIAATDIAGMEDSAFAFSSVAAFEKWIEKTGLTREYGYSKSLLDRTPKRPPRDQQSLQSMQRDVVNRELENFLQRLDRHKLTLENTDILVQAISTYNPLLGPVFGSALLFEHVNGAGAFRYLPTRWTFPDFSWISFDNICSSVIVWGGITLWDQTWFRGSRVWLFSFPGKRYNLFGHPYYFNDVASSGIAAP